MAGFLLAGKPICLERHLEIEALSIIIIYQWLTSYLGGEGGIRTHGELAPTPDFESGTFDHSATSPGREL